MPRDQVFISYSHQDAEFFRQLETLLEVLEEHHSLEVWSDQKRLEAGDLWRQEIEAALVRTKVAVLLVSPDFLASEFIRSNELLPLLAAAEKEGVRIVWVPVRPSLVLKTPLAEFQTAWPGLPLSELRKPQRERAWVEICERILRAAESARSVPADPRINPTIWYIPFSRNPFFTGRKEVLRNLRALLTQNQKPALNRIQAICGLGGIGKTQTAVEYAYRYRNSYDAAFWTRADSPEALFSGFARIARLLNLSKAEDDDENRLVKFVMSWLEKTSGWLLILDNLDNPSVAKNFLPPNPSGHILVTSRAQALQELTIPHPIELTEMSPSEAIQFLLQRTDRETTLQEEKNAASELARELAFLPLALEQAAAFVVDTKVRFQDYVASYRQHRIEILRESRPLIGQYDESITTTWEINFQKVGDTSGEAADLLRLSAFLHSDKIPFVLAGKILKNTNVNPLVLSMELRPLIRYSLIRLDPNSQSYSIHPLVQEVLKHKIGQTACREWAERTIQLVSENFLEQDSLNWEHCDQILPHAEACSKLIKDYELGSREAAELLKKLGFYLHEKARFGEAATRYEQALLISGSLSASSRADIGRLELQLGDSYRRQLSDLDSALRHMSKGIELCYPEKQLAPASTEAARDYRKLGDLFRVRCEYSDAMSCYSKAEEVLNCAQEIITEKENIRIKNERGKLYSSFAHFFTRVGGDDDLAFIYAEESLRLQQETEDQFEISQSLRALANVHLAQRDFENAAMRFTDARLLLSRIGQERHPLMGWDFYNLGEVQRQCDRSDEALRFYERALKIFERENIGIGITLAKEKIGLAHLQLLQDDQGMSLLEDAIESARCLKSAKFILARRLLLRNQAAFVISHARKNRESYETHMVELQALVEDIDSEMLRADLEYLRLREGMVVGVANSVSFAQGFDPLDTIDYAHRCGFGLVQLYLDERLLRDPELRRSVVAKAMEYNIELLCHAPVPLADKVAGASSVCIPARELMRNSRRKWIVYHFDESRSVDDNLLTVARLLEEDLVPCIENFHSAVGSVAAQNNYLRYLEFFKKVDAGSVYSIIDIPRIFHCALDLSIDESSHLTLTAIRKLNDLNIPIVLHLIDCSDSDQQRKDWLPLGEGMIPYEALLGEIFGSGCKVDATIFEYEDKEKPLESRIYLEKLLRHCVALRYPDLALLGR